MSVRVVDKYEFTRDAIHDKYVRNLYGDCDILYECVLILTKSSDTEIGKWMFDNQTNTDRLSRIKLNYDAFTVDDDSGNVLGFIMDKTDCHMGLQLIDKFGTLYYYLLYEVIELDDLDKFASKNILLTTIIDEPVDFRDSDEEITDKHTIMYIR